MVAMSQAFSSSDAADASYLSGPNVVRATEVVVQCTMALTFPSLLPLGIHRVPWNARELLEAHQFPNASLILIF